MILPGPLVDTSWLRDHTGAPGVVVADVRWYLDGRSGRQAYESGHIPGAVFVDVDRDLAEAQPPGTPGGRHPLPSPEAFANAMGRLGIGGGDAVVAYDDAGGAVAARLWWMLDALGHEAAVLDGGVAAWDGPLEPGTSTRQPASFTPAAWPAARLAGATDVAAGDAFVVDVRAPERFRGETEPVDPVAGHIPGALNVPLGGNLGDGGRFLPADELQARYEDLTGEVIVHCGSGINACHAALAMRVAGLADPRVYIGSWSDWVSDPSRPIAP